MAGPLVLAVDIGGTKMAAGAVDAEGALRWRSQVPTPQGGGAEELWAVLVALVDAAPGGCALCGVGCGGPMAPGGEAVSPLNIPGWRGFPLRARLAEHTGLPTWVDNDAKALALAEGWTGVAAGVGAYLSMVVSTGVGGGVVLDGRLLEGATGNAGHIGHVVVEPEGRRCPCGGRGCLEAEASGTSIAAMTGAPARAAPPDLRRRTGTMVGRAVASVANLLDLRLASAAGSVALGYGPAFFAAAQAEIDQRARLEFSVGCRIVPSGLGADGPLVGAAAVGLRGPVGSLRSGARVSPLDRRAVRALLRRPDLWPAAAAVGLRMAPAGWWRRWPPRPWPDPAYLRFRLETMYGVPGSGDPAVGGLGGPVLRAEDLIAYLEWCRRGSGLPR